MTRVEPATGVRARNSDGEAVPAIPAARLLAMMDVAYGLQQFGLLTKAANADAVATAFEGAVEILAEEFARRIRSGERPSTTSEMLRFSWALRALSTGSVTASGAKLWLMTQP